MNVRRLAVLAGVCLCASSPALAGPDWIEGGGPSGPDAGSTKDTADQVIGINSLQRIFGTLTGNTGFDGGGSLAPPAGDFEDMYLLRIETPGMFSFEVAGAGFDAQLFLFNVTLPGETFGLLANNDTMLSNRPLLVSPATDSTGAAVLLPGVYVLGISGVGRVPTSMGGPIFNFASPTEVSGPDGMGGLNPHTGWTGEGQTGSYEIELTGIGWYDVPAPGTGAMMLGLIGLAARRRRSV